MLFSLLEDWRKRGCPSPSSDDEPVFPTPTFKKPVIKEPISNIVFTETIEERKEKDAAIGNLLKKIKMNSIQKDNPPVQTSETVEKEPTPVITDELSKVTPSSSSSKKILKKRPRIETVHTVKPKLIVIREPQNGNQKKQRKATIIDDSEDEEAVLPEIPQNSSSNLLSESEEEEDSWYSFDDYSNDEEYSGSDYEEYDSEDNEEEDDEDDDDFIVSDEHVEYEDGSIAATSEAVDDVSSFIKPTFDIETEYEKYRVFLAYILSSIIDVNFQKKIENERDENYYTPSMQHFYDKIRVVAKSTIQSSRWKQHFMDNLHHLPRYKKVGTVEAKKGKCQMCNKTHTSDAYRVKFYGIKYYPEEIQKNIFNTSSTHEDPGFYTATYVVGKHCFLRSSRYHAIVHYMKYLIDKLRKLIEKTKKKYPKKGTQLVYELLIEEDGWMREYYKGFKTISKMYSDSESPWWKKGWWGNLF